ncbi:MAG TPA: hypothetical protein DHV59_03520 [Oxalobacteraceae bacterium]|nr:hypothetical protein [Oxalobacteraceae bacterium]
MVTEDASTKIAGYTFQFQRALYRMFSSENASTIIGIETDDDVVELKHKPDGSVDVVFEQDKNSTKKVGQPYQDSSKNLWHTLHIWLSEMDNMRSKYQNICYSLVTNKNVPLHAFASQLGAALSDQEIKQCIKEIRTKAKDATGEYEKSIKAVAAYENEKLQFLIKNLKMMDNYATKSNQPPKEATIELFQLPDELRSMGEEIYQSLLGLLVDRCQDAWLKKEQIWLTKSIFTTRLRSEIDSRKIQQYVERPLLSTGFRKYLQEGANNHLFLVQLHRVGATTKFCDLALDDYWGFYAERVRLRKAGKILPDDWINRDYELHRRWSKISEKTKMSGLYGANSDALDMAVLNETIDEGYKANIGSHPTSSAYFTAGNYHDLANREGEAHFVHWHSSFCPDNKKDK